MTLTAVDQYGRPLVRALLRDGATPAGLFAMQHALSELGASFGIFDIAAELGVQVPPLAVYQVRRMPRATPPAKSRKVG